MKEPDYIAIKKPGEDSYTWYDRSTFPEVPRVAKEKRPWNENAIDYGATGKIITREDGEVTEIWEPLP